MAFRGACFAHFSALLPPQQFKTWVAPLTFEESALEVRVLAPNPVALQWIRGKSNELETISRTCFTSPLPIRLGLIPVVTNTESTSAQNSARPAEIPSSSPTRVAPSFINTQSRLNPNFRFDNFVGGRANQLARAAAEQVVHSLGDSYNPFFIYGGVGLGKTHLIQAVGNAVIAQNPQAKVRYIHAEQFVSDVVRAYQHKAFDTFKQYYHSLDLLLVDDIQFFAGKNRTQEEFFYAFNALIEAHKQVIITCDTYPREINNMEDRLISRFGWGLTVAVEPPELEMRVAILLKKAEAEKVKLPEPVAFFVAQLIQSNVRELEGALKRIFAYIRFTGASVSVETAKIALKDVLAVQQRQVSLENIQKTVADYYKLKLTELFSKKRVRSIARPRQMAMALAKELTTLSLPEIGSSFGGRDHTTVMHACRKIAALKSEDTALSRDWDVLVQTLRG